MVEKSPFTEKKQKDETLKNGINRKCGKPL